MNGQHSKWVNIEAGVAQRPILESLFFLVYINDFSADLNSNPNLFVTDASFFSVVQNINSAIAILNSD